MENVFWGGNLVDGNQYLVGSIYKLVVFFSVIVDIPWKKYLEISNMIYIS